MWWVSSSGCWFRVPGDIAMALSFSILWYRFYCIGAANVSVETQILLLIAFLARYVNSSMFLISVYNSAMKIWYILGSAISVALLLFHFRVLPSHMLSRSSPILPMILLSVVVSLFDVFPGTMSYDPMFLIPSISWEASYWIAAGAMIPQLVLMYKTASPALRSAKNNGAVVYPTKMHSVAGIDSGLWAYVASICAFRILYLKHWIWRWRTEGFIDLPSQVPSMVQLIVILSFVLAIVVKVAIRRRSMVTITEHVKDADSPTRELGTNKVVSRNEKSSVAPAPTLPLIVISEAI